MQWILLFIVLFAFVPYLIWFPGADALDWIISITFFIIYPISSLAISYSIIEKNREKHGKPSLKHQSFDNAWNFTFKSLCVISIVGFFYMMAWAYGVEGPLDDNKFQLKPFQPAGIFVFSFIGTIIMAVIGDWGGDQGYNPFKLEKKAYLEKKQKEDAIQSLTKKFITFKQKCTDWTEENKKELQWISKEAKILKRKIDKREEYLNNFVFEYYKNLPTCKRCNSNKLLLLDINDSSTGIEMQCVKCEKNIWIHSNQGEIKNGYKYKNYLDEYFEFYQEGYQLSVLFEKINEKHGDELIEQYLNLEKYEHFDDIIEYEKRFNKTGYLKRGKSYHPLDPEQYLHPKILHKTSMATFMFERDEDIEQNKQDYVIFYSVKDKKIDKKKQDKRPIIPQKIMDAVWNRDGGKCVECGSKENLEFDHRIPFSKGGATSYRNLQLLCQHCNRSKSNKIG